MIEIDRNRLHGRLETFAAIGATRKGGVNRQALTDGDRQARRLLAQLAQQRGFAIFQDPMANLFIRRSGLNDALPPLVIGSHLDSQPSGGRFDGALGTLSAFEVLESLEDAGIKTRRPIVVVAWTNEEGCRFAPGCMGSMAFASGEIPAEWHDKRATDGAAFASELAVTLDSLPEAQMLPLGFPVHAYFEVHIEQGPSLEADGVPIGIVSGIQGTRWLNVTVSGQTAHAGTTGLPYRRDPLRALTTALAALYGAVMPGDPDARFTIGRISVEPGSVNAIPEQACCTVDIRHPDPVRLDALEQMVISTIGKEADYQRCTVAISRTFDMPPCCFSADLRSSIEDAAREAGFGTRPILSGAFHDALFVNRVAPAAMIFVPCRDGLSHNEEEYVEPGHAVAGCMVLAAASLRVAGSETV